MSLKACMVTAALLLLPLATPAQTDEAMEAWLDESGDEAAVAAVADEMAEAAEARVNLNDTAALDALPMLTPFQQRALKNYIVVYGQLLSHKELYLVAGFDSALVEQLEATTIVAPWQPPQRWRLADGHHRLTVGLGSALERAAGYDDGRYDGDPLHAQLVYSYSLHNRISFRLAADKDPSEAWGKGNYYGYHLMLSDIGRLERIIAGRYSLQFGQGLTVWTGLRPFNILGATPERSARGVRPASTFYEEGYLEGLAATIRIARSWHATAFVSSVNGERMAGGHAEYRHGNLIAGLTATATSLDDSVAVADRIYNSHIFHGRRLLNVGADATWQWRRLTLYGEAAVCDSGSAAVIAGATLTADSRNSIGISYRNYSRSYHSLAANPYAIGTDCGEHGWTLDARARLPLRIDAAMSVDLHSFAALRYASYRPSTGSWLRAQLGRRLGQHTTLTLRYADRRQERNVPYSTETTYIYETTMRRQLQATLLYNTGCWTFNTRAALTRFESVGSGNQTGWALAQQARYSRRNVQATMALSLFNVDGYYARIYLSESYLQYNFSMPALYGHGLRYHAVLRYSPCRNMTLAAKYALTHYFDRTTVGSGAAATEGPNRQTLYVQMQWKF